MVEVFEGSHAALTEDQQSISQMFLTSAQVLTGNVATLHFQGSDDLRLAELPIDSPGYGGTRTGQELFIVAEDGSEVATVGAFTRALYDVDVEADATREKKLKVYKNEASLVGMDEAALLLAQAMRVEYLGTAPYQKDTKAFISARQEGQVVPGSTYLALPPIETSAYVRARTKFNNMVKRYEKLTGDGDGSK